MIRKSRLYSVLFTTFVGLLFNTIDASESQSTSSTDGNLSNAKQSMHETVPKRITSAITTTQDVKLEAEYAKTNFH